MADLNNQRAASVTAQGDPSPSSSGRTIQPSAFAPSEQSKTRLTLTPTQLALLLIGVCAVFALWFMFTSKSVALNFSPSAESVEIDGGFSFDLAGVWLLREGTYQIRATSPLHEPLLTEITVGSERNQSFSLPFKPLPGFLELQTFPVDALVTLDPELPATIWQGPRALPAGTHKLYVSHPRYQATTINVDIQGKQITQQANVTLNPNWSEVSVTSTPAGAAIFIDNEPQGITTPGTVQALAGEREIRLSLNGYKSHRERIFAQAEMPMDLAPVKLIQADAQAYVSTRPAGAGVTLNGKFVGQTPLELDIASGRTHNLSIILNGYETLAQTLRLERGDRRDLRFDMRRQLGEVVVIVEPAQAQLSINGELKGPANQTLQLPLKPHELSISLEGYAGFSQTISPKVGITQEVKVKLLTVAEARLRALTPTTTAPDGQNLILFEPYTYQAGASRREPGRRANETLRQVNLTKLFYMGTKEVTNAQFRMFASGHDSGKFVEASLNEDDMPATNLSWHDAAAYCNWLSTQADLPEFYEIEFGKVIGVNPQAKGFRLPTESEWEWAARTQGDDDENLLRFPWGNALPPPDRHGNYADRAASTLVGRIIFGFNDNHSVAAPVGTFRSNSRGLFDMGGNVAEWAHDFYEIPSSETITDSLGPPSGDYHVIKGSSWMHGTITELRYSFRDYGIDGRDDVGFRIARNAE
ncbi:MAG: PEGA domain-containing protein [Pseudomonadota bacterium]